MQKVNWKSWIIHIAIPLAVGGLSAFITRDSMGVYEAIVKPPFAPPPILFPIVWTILFALMGVSAHLVMESPTGNKSAARAIYYLQLVVNFFWPILFFNKRAFLISFIWLVLLWVFIIIMVYRFYRIRPIAGLLQLPYLAWVTFAGVLNFSVYWLNR